MMIAALYVETGGAYYGIPDVDPWDVARDARLYAGPHPVVAHPPCARWGSMANIVEAVHGYKRGDDGGCFAHALDSVRRFGGVLEHPAQSFAWRHFGLLRPSRGGGWSVADDVGGWTCEVEQGAYGNPLRKRTWLYAAKCELPSMLWGNRGGKRWGVGFMSQRDRARGMSRAEAFEARGDRLKTLPDTTSASRAWVAATPPAFRDLLLDMARSAKAPEGP